MPSKTSVAFYGTETFGKVFRVEVLLLLMAQKQLTKCYM